MDEKGESQVKMSDASIKRFFQKFKYETFFQNSEKAIFIIFLAQKWHQSIIPNKKIRIFVWALLLWGFYNRYLCMLF